MIRKATLKDIEPIISVTNACTETMIANGIYQWNANYPNKKTFLNDLKRSELYVLELNKTVKGSLVISEVMDEEYEPVKWLTKNHNNCYIHRLAVHPELQGQGYAQQLMQFAEHAAIKNNNTSIRLDTFSQNKRNQKIYELRGYKRLGNIYFPKQSEHPFYCYELVL